MSAILFDLDGVIYEGNTAIAGATDAVNWFTQNGIPHLFLTNTTSKSRAELVDKLAGFGIGAEPGDFLTPPVAAGQWLKQQQKNNIVLFVPESTREEFDAFNCLAVTALNHREQQVDAVIIGDLGEDWNFATMNRVFRTLIDNPQASLIALGMTRYWKTESGLQLDVGPMIKAFEYAADRTAIVTGKPLNDFYQAALNLLDSRHTGHTTVRNPDHDTNRNTGDDVIMIGDDIRGDIEASQQAGLKAILVRTGKFSETDLERGIRPDAILDSVADLPAWWQTTIPG